MLILLIKKIGVFGGTFNPVHKGHESAAVGFYNRFNLDKLLIIPANIPPHKQVFYNLDNVSAIQRFEMCSICFNRYKYVCNYNIEVSDIEIKKDGLSYSYNTVKNLLEIYPEDENQIYFLVGSDMFLYLEHWHRYKDLLNMCVFVVAFRYNQKNNQDNAEVLKMRNNLVSQGYKIEILYNNPFEISSTDLREKIKNNNFALEEYINPDVLNYIKERKIYALQ